MHINNEESKNIEIEFKLVSSNEWIPHTTPASADKQASKQTEQIKREKEERCTLHTCN